MTEILSNTPAVSTAPRTNSKPAKTKTLPVEPKSVVWNPSPEELRTFTEQMPNCRGTEFANVNVATKVVSRSKLSGTRAVEHPRGPLVIGHGFSADLSVLEHR